MLTCILAAVLSQPSGSPPGQQACGTNCGLSLKSSYSLTTNSTHRIIKTNGIPNHTYYSQFDSGKAANPNKVCETNVVMELSLTPTLGTTFKVSDLGPVGVMVTGGFIYNHLEGPTSGTLDLAIPNHESDLDICNAHPDPTCRYHYHKNPDRCLPAFNSCALVGYLADGFPIYSYCTINSVKLTSCYKLNSGAAGTDSSDYTYDSAAKAAGTCQLDEGNGYCFTDGERGIETGSCRYAYVLSENYPFVMPGYKGAVWYGVNSFTTLLLWAIATLAIL